MSNWSYYSLVVAAVGMMIAMICLLATMHGLADPGTTRTPLMVSGLIGVLALASHLLTQRQQRHS